MKLDRKYLSVRILDTSASDSYGDRIGASLRSGRRTTMSATSLRHDDTDGAAGRPAWARVDLRSDHGCAAARLRAPGIPIDVFSTHGLPHPGAPGTRIEIFERG
jgi:hypothetical protein